MQGSLNEPVAALHPPNDFSIFRRLCGAGRASNRRTQSKNNDNFQRDAMMSPMLYWLVIAAGILALLYGFWATRSVLAASAGNARSKEIAAAIQEGAKAYLNKQYTTIGIVGIIVAVILAFALSTYSAIGF